MNFKHLKKIISKKIKKAFMGNVSETHLDIVVKLMKGEISKHQARKAIQHLYGYKDSYDIQRALNDPTIKAKANEIILGEDPPIVSKINLKKLKKIS